MHNQDPSLSEVPRVSVIIPTLEEERTLRRTLEQFSTDLRKTFQLEIIVSDGGSTDCTLAIARDLADVVIEHDGTCRQNISRGRNRGARAARGEILFFLNADVHIEDPDKFFRMMIEAVENKQVAGATCNVNIYPEEATMLDWAFHNFFNGYFWLLNIFGMGMGRGECQVVRKRTFEQMGGYNESIAAGEDYELFLRLEKTGRIKFVRDVTVFESPRRFRKYGYLSISLLWFINGVSVLLFDRSVTDEWKPVR